MTTHKTQLSDIHEDNGADWTDEDKLENGHNIDRTQHHQQQQQQQQSQPLSDKETSDVEKSDVPMDFEDDNDAIVRNAREIKNIKARLQTKEKLLAEHGDNENATIPINSVCQWLDDWQTITFELEERHKLFQRRMTSQSRRHRGSMVDLHNKMFRKLLDAEADVDTELKQSKLKIKELEKELEQQKQLNERNETQRRGSMSAYSDKMFQKLLDAQDEFEKETQRLNNVVKQLSNELEIEKLKNTERENMSNSENMDNLMDDTNDRVNKALMSQIQQLEEKYNKLEKENKELDQKVKAKELEKESLERVRRGSIKVLSDNMMKKLVDAEEEYESKVKEYENKIKQLNESFKLEKIKNESLNEKYSNSELGKKILGYKQQIEELHKQNNELADLVSVEQQNNEKLERLRQNSIHNLHNNMFQKLLDAEYEYEEEIEKLNKKIRTLQDRIKMYEMGDDDEDIEHTYHKNDKSNNSDGNDNRSKVRNNNNNDNNDNNSENNSQNNNNFIDEDDDEDANDVPMNYANMKNSVTPMGPSDDDNNNNRNTNNNNLKNDTNVSTNASELQNRHDNNNDKNNENLHNAQKQINELEAQNTTLHAEIEELKNELRRMKSKANTIERERRASVTEASKKIFAMQLTNASEQHTQLESLKQNFENKEIELKTQIEQLTNDLETSERNRSESVHVYQKILWKNMGEAEDESNRQVLEIKRELEIYKDETYKLRKENEFLIVSKLNLIEECNQQMNLLRKGLSVINQTNKTRKWF